jgi:hypothetical protein
MPHRPIHPSASWAHTCLFIGVVLSVAVGGGALLMQSGAIDDLNSSGVLTEESSTP